MHSRLNTGFCILITSRQLLSVSCHALYYTAELPFRVCKFLQNQAEFLYPLYPSVLLRQHQSACCRPASQVRMPLRLPSCSLKAHIRQELFREKCLNPTKSRGFFCALYMG